MIKGSIFDLKLSKEFSYIVVALITGSVNHEYFSTNGLEIFGFKINEPISLGIIISYDLIFIVYFYRVFKEKNKENLQKKDNNINK